MGIYINFRHIFSSCKVYFQRQSWSVYAKIINAQKTPFPAGIYLLKVSSKNTRTRSEICSKLTIKTPCSSVSIVNFEHVIAGWVRDIWQDPKYASKFSEILLMIKSLLTLSWLWTLLFRNQFIYLLCKSMDWFLYLRVLRHES